MAAESTCSQESRVPGRAPPTVPRPDKPSGDSEEKGGADGYILLPVASLLPWSSSFIRGQQFPLSPYPGGRGVRREERGTEEVEGRN